MTLTKIFYASFMFIAGLTLLCWDINMRLNVKEPSDRLNTVKNINNIHSESDAHAPAISTNTANTADTATVKVEHNNHLFGEHITRSGSKCLTFEETFEDLVASSTNIFLTMPSKAAGSSLKRFIQACVEGPGGGANPLNDAEKMQKVFYNTFKPPKIIASHFTHDSSFVSLFQNAPRQSLIVYMHRNENDRFISAIKYVVVTGNCESHIDNIEMTIDGPRCVLNENDLINRIIKPKIREIQMGSPKLLSCDVYRAMEDNLPRLVFVHYKQANKLMKVLAKHHCPKMLNHKDVELNVGAENEIEAIVKLKGGEEIGLDEWLEAKRDLIEFTYELRESSKFAKTCQSKTRNMEDDLFGCDDEILEITRYTSF